MHTGTLKHAAHVMVWGCFASNGTGHLYLIDGHMEQRQYHSILVHHMRPSGTDLFPNNQFWFQQDNDPKHKARLNMEYLRSKQEQGFLRVMEWPPQCPDLNPIENLWSIFDQRLKDRQCNRREELFEVLRNAWRELGNDRELLKNLSRSMPRRIEAVLKAKGQPTKY